MSTYRLKPPVKESALKVRQISLAEFGSIVSDDDDALTQSQDGIMAWICRVILSVLIIEKFALAVLLQWTTPKDRDFNLSNLFTTSSSSTKIIRLYKSLIFGFSTGLPIARTLFSESNKKV